MSVMARFKVGERVAFASVAALEAHAFTKEDWYYLQAGVVVQIVGQNNKLCHVQFDVRPSATQACHADYLIPEADFMAAPPDHPEQIERFLNR